MVANKESQTKEDLTENDILFDHNEDLCYIVRQISPRGVTLFRDGREYYIPHTIFSSGIRQQTLAEPRKLRLIDRTQLIQKHLSHLALEALPQSLIPLTVGS